METSKESSAMALIKCSECGKEVSDRAAACPGCGNPLQSGKTGFVAFSDAGPREADVKRGIQRASARSAVGSAIGFVGFALAIGVGIASGHFVVGVVLGVIALVIGIIIQYS
jgi:hypothetical protein